MTKEPTRRDAIDELDQEPETPVDQHITKMVVQSLHPLNQHMLASKGNIMETPKGIVLSWRDTESAADRKHSISVTNRDNHSVVINGVKYPATVNEIRLGLVRSYKRLADT